MIPTAQSPAAALGDGILLCSLGMCWIRQDLLSLGVDIFHGSSFCDDDEYRYRDESIPKKERSSGLLWTQLI